MSSSPLPEEAGRFPCPECAEVIALDARVCRHCHASVLVDVTLRMPVTDARVRHQAARALQAVPGAPVLLQLQGNMTAKRPFVVRGVTRAFAERAIALLAEQRVRAAIERPAPEAATGGSRRTAIAAAAAIIAILLGLSAWRMVLHPSAEPGPSGGSAKVAASAAPAAAAHGNLTPRELAQRSLPSTVSLRCRDSVGSGFFVGADLVLTNAHVLCPSNERMQVVMSDGRKMLGDVVRSDTAVDLGLLHVTGAHEEPLPLGDVGDLAAGDTVMIIGSPIGLEFTVHEGNVSSLSRSTRGVAYVQLDAKINPGNSGGPVIDASGRVVGIVTLKATAAEGIGLALPINYAYSPTLRFVDAPTAAAASSSAFVKMTDGAHAAGLTEKELAASRDPNQHDIADNHRLLAGASVDQYGRLVVHIVRIQDPPPGYEEVTLKLWDGIDNFCTLKGDLSDWKEVDVDHGGTGLPKETLAALKKLGAQRMFVGDSPLAWDRCDSQRLRGSVEMELVGANTEANRMRVNVYQAGASPYGGPGYGGSRYGQSVTTQ